MKRQTIDEGTGETREGTTPEQRESEDNVPRGVEPERNRGKTDQGSRKDGHKMDSDSAELLARYRHELHRVRSSPAYRLGRVLIEATRDWRALVRLPARIFVIWRQARGGGRGLPDGSQGTESIGQYVPEFGFDLVEAVEATYAESGLDPAVAQIERSGAPGRDRARAYMVLARAELMRDVLQASEMVHDALQADASPDVQRRAAFILFDAGAVREPAQILGRRRPGFTRTSTEAAKKRQIQGTLRLLSTLPAIPPRRSTPLIEPHSGRVLYVASSSLPHHVTGYTQRTHALLKSLASRGMEIHCVTRPGYPSDRPDREEVPRGHVHVVDSITYELLSGVHRREVSPDEYITRSADAIERRAKELRPAVIHAASNHEAGLPALIAARRLGLPFIYEVRGLWEYTAASKRPNWEHTERFEFEVRLESLLVQHADAVLTLTQALADELIRRGSDADKIALAPNAIHPEEFESLSRDDSLAESLGLTPSHLVVGYVGAILKYEGLEDLLVALSLLRTEFPSLRALLVGGGDDVDRLKAMALEIGVDDVCIFTGRVSPSQAKDHLALLDAVVLPRKPYPVCQLVSPLKPMEAMAAGIPLVVSDVGALKEMVRENETACVHKSGDPESLAIQIRRLVEDGALRRNLETAARNQVVARHTWGRVSDTVVATYDRVGAQIPEQRRREAP